MPDTQSTDSPAIAATPLSGPNRLDYAHPGHAPAWGERDRRRLVLLCYVIFGTPAAALVYFHAGVAWGRRREGTDTLFKPATGTDFYEAWFVGVPLTAVTLVLAVVASVVVMGFALKHLARGWLLVPVACAAIWLVFFFYLAVAADGPFP